MKIEIWSDVACPWCYIGSTNLMRALGSFDHRDEVRVVWRAFELDPAAPAELARPYVEHLAHKYGTNLDGARGMLNSLGMRGAAAGLDLRFDETRTGNTFDAHRLLHLAGELGIQRTLVHRMYVATFSEGRPIGDGDNLVRLATDVGIPEDAARQVLETDAFADAVRAQEAEAETLGIQGVPFFVFDRRVAVSGAQDPAAMLDTLQRAWRAGALADDPSAALEVWS